MSYVFILQGWKPDLGHGLVAQAFPRGWMEGRRVDPG